MISACHYASNVCSSQEPCCRPFAVPFLQPCNRSSFTHSPWRIIHGRIACCLAGCFSSSVAVGIIPIHLNDEAMTFYLFKASILATESTLNVSPLLLNSNCSRCCSIAGAICYSLSFACCHALHALFFCSFALRHTQSGAGSVCFNRLLESHDSRFPHMKRQNLAPD